MTPLLTKYLLATFSMLVCMPADAAPFLTCDPYGPSAPQPTTFLLSMDGAAEIMVPAVDAAPATAGKTLRYDLAGVPFGRHRVVVKAKNASATSAAATLTFDVGLATPEGMIIVPQ